MHSLLVAFWFFMHITQLYTMKITFHNFWWTKKIILESSYETPTLHAVSRGSSTFFVTDEGPLFMVTFIGPLLLLPPPSVVTAISITGSSWFAVNISNVPLSYMQKHCDSPLLHESSISVITKRNTRPAGSQFFHFSILIQ